MVVSRTEPILCTDEQRNAALLAPAHPLNGIDFVEYRRDTSAPPGQRHRIEVTFLKAPAAALVGAPALFHVLGGVRVVDVRIIDVVADAAEPVRLIAFGGCEGGFSTYYFRLLHS